MTVIRILMWLLLPVLVWANQSAHGFCEQGAQVVVVSGQTSTTRVQGSFPSCTVTVYLTGTTTPATLFADNAGTPKGNPFTANTFGWWVFYAANGRYDVRLSGGGLPAPWTIGDILLADPSGGGGTTVTSVTGGAGITVAPNTGAVVVTNAWGAAPPPGQQTQYLEIKPNTGNNTTLDWASLPFFNAASYNFPAQNTGNLNAGANVVTFTPVPLGVNGSDPNHSLYVSGGTGAAEACLITGGGGTGGQPAGAIIINCANAHTGASVTSASGGIQEAICAMPAAGGTVVVSSSLTLRADVAACGKTAPAVNKLSGAAITGAFTILGQPPNGLASSEYWGAERVAGNFVGGPDGLFAQQRFATYWPTSKQYNTFGVVNNQTTDTTTTTTIGLGAWIRQNTAMGAAVALEPGCEANVPNASCFGMNIVLGTNGPASGATNPTLTGIEVDIEGYYPPSSDSFAYSAVQYNVPNPSPAFIVRNGNDLVTPPAWGQAFYSANGATNTALFAGTRNLGTVNNNSSQNVLFYSIDGTGASHTGELFANASGHLILDFTGFQSSTALKIQAVTSCTTVAVAGSTCNTTVTWPTPFTDTNYFPLCTIQAAIGVPYITNEQNSRTPASTVIQIASLTATPARGLIDCMAIHY